MLSVARAEDALLALASVIRTTLDADRCEVWIAEDAVRLALVARSDDSSAARSDGDRSTSAAPAVELAERGGLAWWIMAHGRSAVELHDGTVRLAPLSTEPERDEAAALTAALARWREPGEVRAFAAPLRVRGHTVGVLRLECEAGLRPTPEQARFLGALAYYAALGVERVRLVGAAERAEADRRIEALRSALLTAISHDIRTPLTTIKGIAYELASGADRARAGDIATEADRLDAMLGDLLDLSRIHAGAVQPQVEVNTVDDLVGAALRQATATNDSDRIRVELPPDTMLSGRFDFVQTLRVVVNLLANALKYSPADAPVMLRAWRDGDLLGIAVLDRGPGVPAEEAERIFEAFYRPPGTPPDVRGTGLGLSIARGLVEAQGGILRYTPREGGGSAFTLTLPAADDTGAADL